MGHLLPWLLASWLLRLHLLARICLDAKSSGSSVAIPCTWNSQLLSLVATFRHGGPKKVFLMLLSSRADFTPALDGISSFGKTKTGRLQHNCEAKCRSTFGLQA